MYGLLWEMRFGSRARQAQLRVSFKTKYHEKSNLSWAFCTLNHGSSSYRFRDTTTPMAACDQEVTLSADDIPGADLSEPFESYTVPQLRWWLLWQ